MPGVPLPQPLRAAIGHHLPILEQCTQARKGGLRDKPGKPVDFYHTCYCLSGLGVTQRAAGPPTSQKPVLNLKPEGARTRGMLRRSDPICNLLVERLADARAFYGSLPPV